MGGGGFSIAFALAESLSSALMKSILLLLVILASDVWGLLPLWGQVGTNATVSAPAASPLPVSTQLRKTVVYLRADCLRMPSAGQLAGMTAAERAKWTPEAIAKLSAEELTKLPRDGHLGTGFVVHVPDERLGKNAGFNYLVTNWHVAQPGIEVGKPCTVVDYTLALNRRGDSRMELLTGGAASLDWHFSSDPSVDLAVSGFALPAAEFDFQTIPVRLFVTDEMVEQRLMVEGDPVLFAGLFLQHIGEARMEPVVRSGSLAMLPDDLILTTLNKPGRVYLAEAHTFDGNSGSPMLVDISKFRGQLLSDYRFLGVVSGEVLESADLELQGTVSRGASVAANSDISYIVPATEVRKLLYSPALQGARDAYVAAHGGKK